MQAASKKMVTFHHRELNIPLVPEKAEKRTDDGNRQQCRDLGRAGGDEVFCPPEMQPVAVMLIAN